MPVFAAPALHRFPEQPGRDRQGITAWNVFSCPAS
ncbi:hypothetical protein A6302_01646 [Methylobrevis pamukkalensis]|uniref:Uncharacterized protein n=1 Tax=Methylobrevis pamukkalensis TaxID=1439726 RepID=A0A1E3H3X3_9HYPH|nr:hypothetical protein A6302_01646 [Methylobrevis pamukkalensis]